MSTVNNGSNQDYANNSDGWQLAGGTTARTLTVTGANITLTGSGSNTYTFPASTDTLVGRASTDTITGTKTFSTAPVFNALPTGTGVASAATASTLASRDANANLTANAVIAGFTTTATAAGTTTMTIASTETQVFTGSSTQTVKLPTTSVAQGAQYTIINLSTGAVTVQSSGANTIAILQAGGSAIFTAAVATPTTAANWIPQYSAPAGFLGQNFYTGGDISSSATSGAPATLTALALTVTIPQGGRPVKLTLSCASNNSAAIGAANYYGIWRGTVGSGTLIKGGFVTDIGAGDDNSFTLVGVDTSPAAGSTTYNIGFYVTSGTGITKASATEQVLFLAEGI